MPTEINPSTPERPPRQPGETAAESLRGPTRHRTRTPPLPRGYVAPSSGRRGRRAHKPEVAAPQETLPPDDNSRTTGNGHPSIADTTLTWANVGGLNSSAIPSRWGQRPRSSHLGGTKAATARDGHRCDPSDPTRGGNATSTRYRRWAAGRRQAPPPQSQAASPRHRSRDPDRPLGPRGRVAVTSHRHRSGVPGWGD